MANLVNYKWNLARVLALSSLKVEVNLSPYKCVFFFHVYFCNLFIAKKCVTFSQEI